MKYTLFTEVIPYGEHTFEYCIDETGIPYVIERYYKIMFHGAGDHIGKPGPLEKETFSLITFSKLREEAKRLGEYSYFDIDESNWKECCANLNKNAFFHTLQMHIQEEEIKEQEFIDDISYIQDMKHTPGAWHQYDFLLAAMPYGWEMIVDWAAYMENADLEDISTLTVSEIANAPETELIQEYWDSKGTISQFAALSQEEGVLGIGGISRTLKMPVKVVWFNQTRVLRIFTLTDDEEMLKNYAETMIRRTFGTKDAMKPAKPVPKEDNPADRRELLLDVIRKAGFKRPDPGYASPGSYDSGASYEKVFGEIINGSFCRTREYLFDLGCLSSDVYDGKNDSVCIDVLKGEPWYVVSSRNGGIADFTIYGGKPISFEFVRALAKASGNMQFTDISEDNWKLKLSKEAEKLLQALQSQNETKQTAADGKTGE